ncbi:hypothetical protein IGS68_06210 [Skermanella sp. TT6]|mgnify:CR=1 FL=1|uniref:Uncharacterized protein n=1 Tax=Skermanella cutis TaxID=2775420 RepID=A0ABX7B8Z7_9PROT|nr:hypothetical protein [Skermanella sp. TT6]QQP90817.1 hypothetical protein IGS68_06210 [Skermanella sp. TT6]
MPLPLRHAVPCAILLLVPTGAFAQGAIPYDTYRDSLGSPNHTGNLTPLPDDRQLLGTSPPPSDPFSERVRPARGYGEIADIGAGFWEWRSDRLRQMRDPSGRSGLAGTGSENR